jgi:hypothetical protein
MNFKFLSLILPPDNHKSYQEDNGERSIRGWCMVGEEQWCSVGANVWCTFGEDYWRTVGEDGWCIMGEDYWCIVARGVTAAK